MGVGWFPFHSFLESYESIAYRRCGVGSEGSTLSSTTISSVAMGPRTMLRRNQTNPLRCFDWARPALISASVPQPTANSGTWPFIKRKGVGFRQPSSSSQLRRRSRSSLYRMRLRRFVIEKRFLKASLKLVVYGWTLATAFRNLSRTTVGKRSSSFCVISTVFFRNKTTPTRPSLSRSCKKNSST